MRPKVAKLHWNRTFLKQKSSTMLLKRSSVKVVIRKALKRRMAVLLNSAFSQATHRWKMSLK